MNRHVPYRPNPFVPRGPLSPNPFYMPSGPISPNPFPIPSGPIKLFPFLSGSGPIEPIPISIPGEHINFSNGPQCIGCYGQHIDYF